MIGGQNRKPATNRRLAQWRVTWLIEHSTSHQLLCYIDSFESRNPPLRQAPKRYAQAEKTTSRQTFSLQLEKTKQTENKIS